jgi:hypothetical protein
VEIGLLRLTLESHSKKRLLYVTNLDYGQFAFSWNLEPATHFLSVCGLWSSVAPGHGFPDGSVHTSCFLANAVPTIAGATTRANALTIAIAANAVFVFIISALWCKHEVNKVIWRFSKNNIIIMTSLNM